MSLGWGGYQHHPASADQEVGAGRKTTPTAKSVKPSLRAMAARPRAWVAMPLVITGLWPCQLKAAPVIGSESTSACRTHLRRVSREIPRSLPMAVQVALGE